MLPGRQVYRWPNGDQFEGMFVKGAMLGRGVYRFAPGLNQPLRDVYTGTMRTPWCLFHSLSHTPCPCFLITFLSTTASSRAALLCDDDDDDAQGSSRKAGATARANKCTPTDACMTALGACAVRRVLASSLFLSLARQAPVCASGCLPGRARVLPRPFLVLKTFSYY
jgi:hypothetical protein